MNIFDISPEKMKETSSVFTLTDINQQPFAWKKTCEQAAACKEEMQELTAGRAETMYDSPFGFRQMKVLFRCLQIIDGFDRLRKQMKRL